MQDEVKTSHMCRYELSRALLTFRAHVSEAIEAAHGLKEHKLKMSDTYDWDKIEVKSALFSFDWRGEERFIVMIKGVDEKDQDFRFFVKRWLVLNRNYRQVTIELLGSK